MLLLLLHILEQPGDLQNAFAFYSAHGAPYGDKKRSPQPHKAQMCGSSFSRMCKSNGLVANHIGRQDVIFTEVKRKEKGVCNNPQQTDRNKVVNLN